MPAEYSRLIRCKESGGPSRGGGGGLGLSRSGGGTPPGRSKLGLLALASLSALCLISFLLSQTLVTTLRPTVPLIIGRSIQSLESNEVQEAVNVSQDMEEVLTAQRERIVDEILRSYHFPAGRSSPLPVRSLSDLVPALGGRPIRSVIIATWRSGSTFLGDLLNSVPGNYYHYEPLLHLGIVQVRGPPLSGPSLRHLKQLLLCNYTGMDEYLHYGQEHTWLLSHNSRLWEKCLVYPYLCWLPAFLSQFCSLFPFQSMKLVRLRLRLAEDLLADTNLGVKVVLVVRDPRGTIQSRRHRDWCPGQPDCSDPALLCADLVSDFSAARDFTKRYTNNFKVIRYENFSLDPYKGTEELFKFLGLEMGTEVRKFLDTHTKSNAGGVSSTYRNSKAAPFHWRSDLTFPEVEAIQGHCLSAMQLWGPEVQVLWTRLVPRPELDSLYSRRDRGWRHALGGHGRYRPMVWVPACPPLPELRYVRAMNASHQKSFNPIKRFTFKP